MIHEFRLSPPGSGRGVSCDENGAFIGAMALLERSTEQGRDRWKPRSCDQLSKHLSSWFGLPIDLSSKSGGLKAIANALNDGDIARAQIATVLLGIPDRPPLSKGVSSRDAMIKFIRDLHWSGMIKADWDPDEHPRWPAGTPDSQGGQFAPKDGGNSVNLSQFKEPNSTLAEYHSASDGADGLQPLQQDLLSDAVYHPGSDAAALEQVSDRTTDQSAQNWKFARTASPDVAPGRIDLSHLDATFQSLMSQSFPKGKPIERGGTLFVDTTGQISIGNIGGLGSSDKDFTPDLTSPAGLATIGFFHTHPYANGLSQPFSSADVAEQINYHMDASVVQSDGGNQWLLLSTSQTPTGHLDRDAVEQWAERLSPTNPINAIYESTQYAVVMAMARQYHMAFYTGRNGVFARVFPPLR